MGLSPYDEAMAAQTGRSGQAISPSEEAAMLEAEQNGTCPCCGQQIVTPAPF